MGSGGPPGASERRWAAVRLVLGFAQMFGAVFAIVLLLVAACAARRGPRRRAGSFLRANRAATRISTWMVEVIMPPTMGAAIGFITSEPMPDSQRIGMRLARTTHTVINFSRSRCTAH